MQVSEIIAALGGARRIAARFGMPGKDVGAKRVRAWAIRGRVPARYWPAVVSLAEELGVETVTFELLESCIPSCGQSEAA